MLVKPYRMSFFIVATLLNMCYNEKQIKPTRRMCMELLQLRYFYESARNESFTETAKKYMVPTSSVSASVRNLEKELGCNLFDRTYNRIILNNNGKRLQQALSSVFLELEGAIRDLNDTITDKREIKILVRAMRNDITDYIIEYSKQHPSATFKMLFGYEKDCPEDYDIIIDEKTDIYQKYEMFELFNMRIRLKVASGSSLLGRKFTLKQLYNKSFISLSEENNMHKMLLRACKRAGFSPNIVAQVNDIGCYEKMIASGIGIGLGRENVNLTSPSNIGFLDVTDFNERYVVCAYYKKESAYGNVKKFLSFINRQQECKY